MMKIYFPLLCLIMVISSAFGQSNVTILGDATTMAGCNCVQITPDAGNQAGAFYLTHPINLNNSFDYTFNCFWGCGTNCGGNADGMVFALTANPGSLGGQGQSLGWGNGYGSQPCSVGVEFDTWQNGGSCSSGGECDPGYNELAIMANGDVCHCDANNTLAGYVPIQANQANVYDCNWHEVEIKWDVTTGTLSVYFDGNLRLSYTNPNMVATWFCGNPTVYWGWSGSTGGGCETQAVCVRNTSTFNVGTDFESCDPTVQFHDISSSDTANESWNWQFGDGGTSNLQNPSHTYSGPGTYTATLIITNTLSGCADTSSNPVVIAPPIALTPTATNPVCNGALDGDISVSASGGFGPSAGLGGYQYSWNTGGIGPSQVGLGAGTYVVTCTDGVCTSTASFTLTQPTALTAVTSSTAASCGASNGTVSVTISGGVTPYTIDWVAGNYTTPTVTGLAAGTYVCNFTDANGCSAALEYTATVSQIPCGYTLSTAHTNVTCFGMNNGTATVTITGYTPPLNFTWNPAEPNSGSLSNLPPGTYNFSAQDNTNNPPLTGTIVITQPPKLVVSLAVSPTTCGAASGQAVVSIDSGGVQPFSYAWSVAGQGNNPVASGLSPGAVTVTVTDNTGCTATATGTITGPPPLTLAVTPINDSCFTGQGPLGRAIATPSGGTPWYTFMWSNNSLDSIDPALLPGTYTVTVTDAGGCTVTGSATITALSTSKVTHTISQINVACFGTSTGSITVTPAGGTGPYTYAWYPDSTFTGSNATGLSAGVYGVTISDALGCQNTDTANITQPASAVSVATSVSNVSCNGGTNGFIAFAISGGTPPYSYLGNQIPAVDTIKNLPAGDYSAVITDANQCAITVYDTITQPGPQSITFSNQTNETCFGQNIGTVTATFVNATGAVNFEWSDTATGATVSNLLAGTYSVTGTDANGCSAVGSVTITQPASQPLNVAVVNSTCYGQPGGALATPTGGTNPYTYAWSAPAIGIDSAAIVPAGTNYTVTATDANHCEETATFSVTQPPHINITISQVNVGCFGASTGSITLTVMGGTPGYTYQWTPATAVGSNPTGLAAGLYSVTVTDLANCSVDTSTTITQPAGPLTVVEDSVNIACFGQSTGSITLIVTGGTPQYSYTWNPNVATDSTPSALAMGTYAYTVQDANGCSVDSSVSLIQPAAALTVTTSEVNVLCFDSSTGVVIAIPSGGTSPYTYSWSPNVGNTDTVSNVLAGSYSVTVTDFNGCTISAPVVVTQPQMGLSETETQVNDSCFGNANGSIAITAGGGTGNLSYTWNPNISTTDNATALAAGVYALTITDANNCTLGASYTITQPGQLTVSAIGTNDSCFGQANGTIIATADSGTPGYNYSAAFNGTNTPSATGQFTGLAAGSYTIYATDQNGCVDSTTYTITQPPVLSAIVNPSNPTCYGYTNGSIAVTGTGGTPNYTYIFSTGAVNSTGNLVGLAQGTYMLTVSDANSCAFDTSVVLVQPDSFIIAITPAVAQVNLGDSLPLETSTNQSGSMSYAWYPNNGLSCYNCADPVFDGVYTETYQVTVTTSDSCMAVANFSVTVVPNYNIFIPNVFSPVGNGANDFWQIFGDFSSLKQVYVSVFDRWGEKVFESDDMNFKWDGTFKGKPAPEGVYVYSIKFVWLDNHSDDGRKGSITLLR